MISAISLRGLRSARLAAAIAEVPFALIAFVDAHRHWFKARVGIESTSVPRDDVWCQALLDQPPDPLVVEDSTITGNHASEGGGAIFFVSNDRTGTLTIDGSTLTDNPSDGFETLPGIFFLGASRTITDSVVR